MILFVLVKIDSSSSNFSKFSLRYGIFQNSCGLTSSRSCNSRRFSAARRGTVYREDKFEMRIRQQFSAIFVHFFFCTRLQPWLGTRLCPFFFLQSLHMYWSTGEKRFDVLQTHSSSCMLTNVKYARKSRLFFSPIFSPREICEKISSFFVLFQG